MSILSNLQGRSATSILFEDKRISDIYQDNYFCINFYGSVFIEMTSTEDILGYYSTEDMITNYLIHKLQNKVKDNFTEKEKILNYYSDYYVEKKLYNYLRDIEPEIDYTFDPLRRLYIVRGRMSIDKKAECLLDDSNLEKYNEELKKLELRNKINNF